MARILVGCGLLLAWAVGGCASAASQGWVEVTTPNFRVVSNVSERHTVKLATRLESFRAAVLKVLGLEVSPRSLPTDVYLVEDPTVWDDIVFQKHLAGYFRDLDLRTVREPVCAGDPASGDGAGCE